MAINKKPKIRCYPNSTIDEGVFYNTFFRELNHDLTQRGLPDQLCYWCEKKSQYILRDFFQKRQIFRCEWCPYGDRVEKFMKIIKAGLQSGKIRTWN